MRLSIYGKREQEISQSRTVVWAPTARTDGSTMRRVITQPAPLTDKAPTTQNSVADFIGGTS